MADQNAKTAEKPASAPVRDRDPKDAENATTPSRAGAHGADETEARTGTGSGLSGDKGVAEVGDPALPTGNAKGVSVGQPDKHGVMEGRDDRTLEGQLRKTGLAGGEDDAGE